jgi:hypothetical protein
MQRHLFFTLIFAFLCGAVLAQADEEEESENPALDRLGKVIRLKLRNAPFPADARKEGYRYQDSLYTMQSNYNDSTVLVFVPKKFNNRVSTDMVIYMHGWYNNVDSSLAQFNLVNQFAQAEKNALLVMPQGPYNAPDSHGGKFELPDGMVVFLNELVSELIKAEVLRNQRMGSLLLAGHSGAYRALAHMAVHGGYPVSEICLLDGLYSHVEKFTLWIERNPKTRFFNVYSEHSPETKENTESMMLTMKAFRMSYLHLKDKDASLADIEKNRVIFLESALKHNEVVVPGNNLYKFLVTSPNLKNLPE